jgi:prepilin-type N-terminal cleavage/methylation domain-containing protein
MKQTRSPRQATRHGAFTMVELMVVITIAAVITAMTVGGYRSVAEGNQRVSCQTNLTQIYQALRLYSNDYDGFFPAYDPTSATGKGLGLWALYAKQSNSSPDQPADLGETFLLNPQQEKPFAIYLRSRKQLHCPADTENESWTTTDAGNMINTSFLSYQVQDGATWTYQPWRGVSGSDWRVKRQLLRYNSGNLILRSPLDNTVVTWCKWHRGAREIDNVLFYDGTVRRIPKEQENPTALTQREIGEPTVLQDWTRKPAP